MGVFDWIFDPMVRKFGQASRDRAIQFSVMRVKRVTFLWKIINAVLQAITRQLHFSALVECTLDRKQMLKSASCNKAGRSWHLAYLLSRRLSSDCLTFSSYIIFNSQNQAYSQARKLLPSLTSDFWIPHIHLKK